MKKRVIILFYSLTLFLVTSVIAQTQRDTLWFDSSSGNYIIQYIGENDTLVTVFFEPATKINPIITSKAVRAPGVDSLVYSYAIRNGESSKQNLLAFEVEYEAPVVNATSNRWHSWRVGEGRVVQNRWVTFDVGRWHWSGDVGLKPTRGTDGFALKSKGLPGVVNSYFQGLVPVFATPDEGPSYKIDQQLAQLELFPANRVIRKTIGPVLPPSPFVAIAFLDTLISYKHQAVALGWLKDKKENESGGNDDDDNGDTIAKNLDKRLEKVGKELVKGDSAKARDELQKFVKKIEKLYEESQEREKNAKEDSVLIASEAYALLKFNAEYLIERLPVKKKE